MNVLKVNHVFSKELPTYGAMFAVKPYLKVYPKSFLFFGGF